MKLPSLHIGDQQLGHAYSNERIVLIVHHHWWNLLKEVAGVAILFVAPLIVIPFVSIFFVGANAIQAGAVFGLVGSLWALVCWHQLFTRWTDYYYDVWIITNWRIIDMHLDGLFNVNIGSMLDLDHIQEISTHTEGIIQNILGIGRILVQTAATRVTEFEFEEVSSPAKIENIIRRAQVELHAMKAQEGNLSHGV